MLRKGNQLKSYVYDAAGVRYGIKSASDCHSLVANNTRNEIVAKGLN